MSRSWEYAKPVRLETGETFQVSIKYFDYGVVSIELELDFETDWAELITLSESKMDLCPGNRKAHCGTFAVTASGEGAGSTLPTVQASAQRGLLRRPFEGGV